MTLDRNDIKIITQLLDGRLSKLRKDINSDVASLISETIIPQIDALGQGMDDIEQQLDSMERKLDRVTDHHARRLGEHEKRITSLEERAGLA